MLYGNPKTIETHIKKQFEQSENENDLNRNLKTH